MVEAPLQVRHVDCHAPVVVYHRLGGQLKSHLPYQASEIAIVWPLGEVQAPRVLVKMFQLLRATLRDQFVTNCKLRVDDQLIALLLVHILRVRLEPGQLALVKVDRHIGEGFHVVSPRLLEMLVRLLGAEISSADKTNPIVLVQMLLCLIIEVELSQSKIYQIQLFYLEVVTVIPKQIEVARPSQILRITRRWRVLSVHLQYFTQPNRLGYGVRHCRLTWRDNAQMVSWSAPKDEVFWLDVAVYHSPVMNVPQSNDHLIDRHVHAHELAVSTRELLLVVILQVHAELLHNKHVIAGLLAKPVDFGNTLHSLQMFEHAILVCEAAVRDQLNFYSNPFGFLRNIVKLWSGP